MIHNFHQSEFFTHPNSMLNTCVQTGEGLLYYNLFSKISGTARVTMQSDISKPNVKQKFWSSQSLPLGSKNGIEKELERLQAGEII